MFVLFLNRFEESVEIVILIRGFVESLEECVYFISLKSLLLLIRKKMLVGCHSIYMYPEYNRNENVNAIVIYCQYLMLVLFSLHLSLTKCACQRALINYMYDIRAPLFHLPCIFNKLWDSW